MFFYNVNLAKNIKKIPVTETGNGVTDFSPAIFQPSGIKVKSNLDEYDIALTSVSIRQNILPQSLEDTKVLTFNVRVLH
ncbi:hypothetical protein [Dyadobacter sp. CY312]|uniref:hypothetical protein n=1 Tax=Dyadobacter sp. CY312 TaxID=2907303 RepID=UPI001F43F194|nr:hypothetical protein [Dyadobacter sp. CY312]MCE7040335.1 hypothetical protein [Dyadobacter sp. CY312]